MEQATANLLGGDLACQCCFEQDQFSAFFLSPTHFRSLARWVGAERARSYRRVSPHGPEEIDLDGRDGHYWHLLILDRDRRSLAGSLRLALSTWHGTQWDSSRSYLEHCYPGLDQAFRQRNEAYAEIGRTFVAMPYQRHSPVLLMLLRAMVSIPLATGHPQLLGLVSYNHFQQGEALRNQFLSSLLRPPFVGNVPLPPPRHPFPSQAPDQRKDPGLLPPETLGQLERRLEQEFQEPFRVPLLVRKYMAFGNARVAGLSLAKDFNQICEILMHCDLPGLLPHQRRVLIINDLRPVWEGHIPGPGVGGTVDSGLRSSTPWS
ncbi:MAG: GNAT family N-acetyltransferase [Cyanobacteriota bacterium]|nr:GNAT family N-acetyltransferase [Cyanobacteriota bacterium]